MNKFRAKSKAACLGTGLVALLLLTPLDSALGAGDVVTIREDSPDAYVVVRGDTLWDIAGRFLEQPWLWPQIWQLNPQIENPDLIYPGDVIELVYNADGSPALRLSRAGSSAPVEGIRTVRLSPEVRREPILSPIPAIPLDQIDTYLSENTVVSMEVMDNAPYILGERNGRNLADVGTEVFARGAWTDGVLTYDVIRPGRNLINPDTGEPLGVEAIAVGSATITSYNGSEAFMEIVDTHQEVRKGDRLVPSGGIELDAMVMPAPPNFPINAAIVAIGSNRSRGGMYDTLILNAGTNSGLQVGDILTVEEPPVLIEDRVTEQSIWTQVKQAFGTDVSQYVEFPGKEIATVLIYKVQDVASMGLILKVDEAVELNYRAVTP